MKNYVFLHIHIALHLVSFALAIICGVWFAHYSNANTESVIQAQVSIQKNTLEELALITDQNGADATVAAIIHDCTRRDEYESLLIKLGSLPKKDLITVQNLFEQCGSFYAERKALMVSKLVRELESLNHQNDLLIALSADPVGEKELSQWEELILLEKKRSTLLDDQNTIQAKIITELISGATANSENVRALVQDAQQIAELLTVHDHEIDAIRKSLTM